MHFICDNSRKTTISANELMLRYERLKKIRTYVCFVTKEAEVPNNWGENDFMKNEVQFILENCPWNRIYDIIEYFYGELCDKKATLGKLINDNPDIVPNPSDKVIKEVFAFASDQGRHLREGATPDYKEAELVVHLSASLCTYLTKKNFSKESDSLEDEFNMNT